MILFLYLPDKPVPLSSVTTRVAGTFDVAEQKVVEDHWKSVIAANPKTFSKPGALGTFVKQKGMAFEFAPTEFKIYAAVAAHPDKFGDAARALRISCVGGVVRLPDGSVIMRKRPMHAAHPGKFDATFSGFAFVDNGTIAIEKAIRDKLQKELHLEDSDIASLQLTGIHTESEHDFSCMFDVIVDVKRAPALDANYHVVNDAVAFVTQHKKDMLPDGAAAVFAAVPHTHENKRFMLS